MIGEFHRLRTCYGTAVAEDLQSHTVSSFVERDISPERPLLALYVPAARRDICFLISGKQNPLWMPPGLGGLGLLPFGLGRDGVTGAYLYGPDDGAWVFATPLDDSFPPKGKLEIARRTIKVSERFRLSPIDQRSLSAFVLETASTIEAMLARKLDVNLIRSLLPLDATNLQAVARLTPHSQLEALAAVLLDSVDECERFARLFPADIFAQSGLLPLSADFAARRHRAASDDRPTPIYPKPMVQTIGTEFDRLSTQGLAGEYISLPHTLNAMARSKVPPIKDFCIIAIARNEGLYLLDWLAYHRAIGAQAVFLYTNDNDDGSDQLLGALAKSWSAALDQQHPCG